MKILYFLSDFMIPLVILYVIAYGLLMRVNIFDAFIKGAEDGLRVVVGILPTLIGLLVAIGTLRASGTLEFIGMQIGKVTQYFFFPQELVPLVLVKMFSSSAATGLLLDLYKTYGVDSEIGVLASVLMSCSETIFYTISVYFLATKDKEHKPVTGMRWLLAGALLSTLAGTMASVLLSK